MAKQAQEKLLSTRREQLLAFKAGKQAGGQKGATPTQTRSRKRNTGTESDEPAAKTRKANTVNSRYLQPRNASASNKTATQTRARKPLRDANTNTQNTTRKSKLAAKSAQTTKSRTATRKTSASNARNDKTKSKTKAAIFDQFCAYLYVCICIYYTYTHTHTTPGIYTTYTY